MKIMCQCGRDIRHEAPFEDFHVERVQCTAYCHRAKALETGQKSERLSDVFPNAKVVLKPTGMLGH